MKLEAGKPYITGNGRKVRIICTDVKGRNNKLPAIGLVSVGNEEFISRYTADGHCNYCSKHHDSDIVAEYPLLTEKEVEEVK